MTDSAIQKIADSVLDLQSTLTKSRHNASLQPLNSTLHKPRDMSHKVIKSTVESSHLEDKRITHEGVRGE